ncbi:MAG TPA: hypothetical protein VHX16_08065, partial [Chloroflexota bacterium]|nr:hypothetical protein [Chloroflexota bacterium]
MMENLGTASRQASLLPVLDPRLAALLLALALALVLVGQTGILAPTLSWLPVASYVSGLLLFAGLNEL